MEIAPLGPENQTALADIELSPPSCNSAPLGEMYNVFQALHAGILQAASGKVVDGTKLVAAETTTLWSLRSGGVQEQVNREVSSESGALWTSVFQETLLKAPTKKASLKRSEFGVQIFRDSANGLFTARTQMGRVVLSHQGRLRGLRNEAIAAGAQMVEEFLNTPSPKSIVCKNVTRHVTYFDTSEQLDVIAESEYRRDVRDKESPSTYIMSLLIRSPSKAGLAPIIARTNYDKVMYASFMSASDHSKGCDTAELTSQQRKCDKKVDAYTLTSSRLHKIQRYGQNVLAQINQLPSATAAAQQKNTSSF